MSKHAALYKDILAKSKNATNAQIMEAVVKAMEGMELSDRLDLALYAAQQLQNTVTEWSLEVDELRLETHGESRREMADLLSRITK